MSELYKVLKFVQVYMDDIIVHCTTLCSHHDHLRHAFAAPLHRLASNITAFFWSPPRRYAVANIKYVLANSTVLSIFDGSLPTRITCDASSFDIGAVLEQQHPDGWHPTRITCDASSFGIGEVLEQQHPDGWHPTRFLSRTLSKPETNYPSSTRSGSPSYTL
ncbi:hypothetical protein Efla_007409 [Eimeria flavescens]